MGKVNTQLKFMCGRCKNFFVNNEAVTAHINAKHKGQRVGIYVRTEFVDLRTDDDEPSMATRQIDAMLAVAMGEHTDDDWLLP